MTRKRSLAAGIAMVLTVGLLGPIQGGLVAANAAPRPPRMTVPLAKIMQPNQIREPGQAFTVRARIVNRGGTDTMAQVSVEALTESGPQVLSSEPMGPFIRRGKGQRRFDLSVNAPDETGTYPIRVCTLRRGETGLRVCRTAPTELSVVEWVDGARTLNDPYLPHLGNGGYDALHYDLYLNYDPARMENVGGDTCTWPVDVTSPCFGIPAAQLVRAGNRFLAGTHSVMTAEAEQDLKTFSMDFLPNSPYTRCTTTNNAAQAKTCTPKAPGLTISSITVNGVPATWENVNLIPAAEDPNTWNWGESKMIITPGTVGSRPRTGEEFVVDVTYTGEPQEIFGQDLDWEGWLSSCRPNKNTPTFCDGSYVVNEPSGAMAWFPNNNAARDKATYDFYHTIPNGKQSIGNGELESVTDNEDGTETWHWNEDSPMMSYLSTSTIGKFNFAVGSMEEDSTERTLPINDFVDPNVSNPTTVNNALARTPEMVNWLSEQVGPYPHNSTGAIVDFLQGVGYALEVQTKPAFAGGSVGIGTLLHEHAHQWQGGAVGPATWREIWFNEGWATFLTNEWQFDANGSATAPSQSFWTFYNAGGTNWGTAPAALAGPAQLFSSTPVYTRPGHMLQGLRQIMGDAAFWQWSKDLMVEFGDDSPNNGVISTQQFIDFAVDEYAGTEPQKALLEQYLEQWLRGTVKPTVSPLDFGTFLIEHKSKNVSALGDNTASIQTVSSNLGGANGTVRVQYSTDPTLETGVTNTATQAVNAGVQNQARTFNLTGLTAGTTYYYRVEGTNGQGTSHSSIASFTTTGGPPPNQVVEMTNYAFTPAEFTVASGATIELHNLVPAEHNFTVDGEIDVTVDGEDTESVLIDLDPGVYDFVCSFHADLDMNGTMTVT